VDGPGQERDYPPSSFGLGTLCRWHCGTGDAFITAARHYVEGFARRPGGEFSPGGHTLGYWRRMAPAQLAFVADNLG
jgi:hypothetical protein